MASWHLIPKAPRALFILLTGSVVISRPSYPVACRSRGVSGIDSTAGEVLREASTSDIILVAAVATRHMSRCLRKVSSLRTQTGRALPPCLAISKTFSTRSRAWQGGSLPLAILLVPAGTNTPPTCGPARTERARSGAATGTRGSGAPSLLVLADLPAGEASAEPVVHGRGRDLSDTGPTTEGPVVDTLLPDGADKTR